MPAGDFQSIFQLVDREIWLVTAQVEPGTRRAGDHPRGGLIATFITPASIAPDAPRVILGLAHAHHTCLLVQESRAFALHLLGVEHLEWVWRFGLGSGRDVDKLAGLPARTGASGSPILDGAIAWLDCRVEETWDSGDRSIFLAQVIDSSLSRTERPLTTHRLAEIAPAERLAQLQELYDQDGARDSVEIRRWRAKRLRF